MALHQHVRRSLKSLGLFLLKPRMSVQEFRRCFSPDGLTLLSSEQCCYRGSKQQTVSSTHPVHKIDSPHCADLGRVIDEADVSLCGSVQLSDLNVPEAIYEL